MYVVEGVGFEDGFGGGDILIVIFVFAAEMSHVIFTKNKSYIKRSEGIKENVD